MTLSSLLVIDDSSSQSLRGNAAVIAVSPDFENDQTVFCALNSQSGCLIKSTNKGLVWNPSQIGLSPRPIKDLAISPDFSNDQIVFAGIDSDGVYKTTDGGETWAAMSVGLGDLEVTKLAISPRFDQDKVIFAGVESGQIFFSSDGGSNWIPRSSGLPGIEIRALAISPAFNSQDEIIYLGTSTDGVYVSTDAGDTWNQAIAGLSDLQINTLAISNDFAADGTLFVGTLSQGVFKSINGGLNWDAYNSGIIDLRVVRIAVSPLYGSDQTVFCVSNDTGAYKSTDGGTSWVLYESGLEYRSTESKRHFRSLAFSPEYQKDGTIFVGMFEGLFLSINTGIRYFPLNVYPQTIVRSIAVSPDYTTDGTIFAATQGGGIYRSSDGGSTWSAINTGLADPTLTTVVVSPDYENDQKLWTGSIEYINASSDQGNVWIPRKVDFPGQFFAALSLAVSPDFTQDKTLFTGNYGCGLFPLYHSNDSGTTYQPVILNVNSVAAVAFSPSFSNDDTVYLGTNDGVLRSTNEGTTFEYTSNDRNADGLAVSPNFANDQTLFMGEHFGGVYKSIDAGGTWFETSSGLPDNVAVTQIVVSNDFANDQTIFASTLSSGIRVSSDGGTNWTLFGLEGNYLDSVALSPDFPVDGTVFAGGWDGVYKKTPGANWNRVLFMTRYEESSHLLKVDGDWNTITDPYASAGAMIYSDMKNASITIFFVGTEVNWIGSTSPMQGIAAVYLDGVFIAEIDQYSPLAEFQKILFDEKGLPKRLHRLKIIVTGISNPSSFGEYIAVDAFEVVNDY